MSDLLLSVFPGIDLLGRAFEEEGYCVVRGPDLLWGGDARTFHPPVGVFEGVIGGPPCQAFSPLRALNDKAGRTPRFGNLIPEFERIVRETSPRWFLMENTQRAPIPQVKPYRVEVQFLRDFWVGGVQKRGRVFSFGVCDESIHLVTQLAAPALLPIHRSVLAQHREGYVPQGHRARMRHKTGGVLPHEGRTIPIEDVCETMGLPRDFMKEMPFTMRGKQLVLANAIPMAMGRAVAKAIRRATS